MRRLLRFVGGLQHAGLAGGFFALSAFAKEGGPLLALLLFGWLYGVAVLGLLRLFPVAPWGFPIAGLFAGPVPAALLSGGASRQEWGGIAVVAALLGLLIGLLEAARQSRLAREASRDGS